MRAGRQPSDKELKKAANEEAKRCALAGDLAGVHAAQRRLKVIAARALAAQKAQAQRPAHPVYARQEALWTNVCRFKDRTYLRLGLLKVPPHPTKKEERAFARRRDALAAK